MHVALSLTLINMQVSQSTHGIGYSSSNGKKITETLQPAVDWWTDGPTEGLCILHL